MEVGRTEVKLNCINPEFATSIKVPYVFETVQQLSFSLYDNDNLSKSDLKAHKLVGLCSITLSSIMSNGGEYLTCFTNLKNEPIETRIKIGAEEIKSPEDYLSLKLSAEKLTNKDLTLTLSGIGKSDPFYKISRKNNDGTFTMVFESKVIMDNLNPKWEEVNIPLSKLCKGDVRSVIKFDVYDWDSDGSHDFIGGWETSVAEFVSDGFGAGTRFPLIDPKETTGFHLPGYTDSGKLLFNKIHLNIMPSLGAYIRGGCDFNMSVAIDFTGSNGAVTSSNSLHYHSAKTKNPYQEVIQSISLVLQEYDADSLIPAYGYGAVIKKDGKFKCKNSSDVNHDFPLTLSDKAEVEGLNGLLKAYDECCKHVELYGPTHAAPVLNQLLAFVKDAKREVTQLNQKYFTKLIITDGELNDMPQTIKAIVDLSYYPVSVIIVGVGTGV